MSLEPELSLVLVDADELELLLALEEAAELLSWLFSGREVEALSEEL